MGRLRREAMRRAQDDASLGKSRLFLAFERLTLLSAPWRDTTETPPIPNVGGDRPARAAQV